MTNVTISVDRDVVQAASLVGNVVTYAQQQWTVHSVEGATWYAFDDRGQTTIDTGLTGISILYPRATILPMGAKLGQGRAVETPTRLLRRGVCLAKTYR
jgi:hypothetical protein